MDESEFKEKIIHLLQNNSDYQTQVTNLIKKLDSWITRALNKTVKGRYILN